jgi:hypothetical protein
MSVVTLAVDGGRRASRSVARKKKKKKVDARTESTRVQKVDARVKEKFSATLTRVKKFSATLTRVKS